MHSENKPLELDWDKLMPKKETRPPSELVVMTEGNNEQPQTLSSADIIIRRMTDHELSQSIARKRKDIDQYGPKLPDNGAKLRANLKICEDEEERRRKIQRLNKIEEEFDKPMQSQMSHSSGARNGARSGAASHSKSPSSFATRMFQKLEEKPDFSTPTADKRAFDEEISYLNPGNTRPTKLRKEVGLSSRKTPLRCPSSRVDKEKKRLSNGSQKHIPLSTFYFPNPDRSSSNSFSNRRKGSEMKIAHDSRSRKKVSEPVFLVVDEEEPSTQRIEQENEPVGRFEGGKFYYPSRDDPEAIEICHTDIECLDPEVFLSSTIMNFYIRYLRRPLSATGRSRGDYHFFNTYFYEKLKEAVSHKGDKEAFFVKFRRWWKGVNLFEKSYILLPIHESLHWSLVIICIPDKEDDSGPVILHLDSLGYHDSKQIFHNVRRLLIEEWKYLKQEAPPEPPMADRIWEHLPRRIFEDIITVPQQKNDYDCGIFVLFFMERFIEEAPERLKKKDLDSQFGRRWFKPEEASKLRKRIRNLLEDGFQNAMLENATVESDSRESSPASSADTSDELHDLQVITDT